MNQPGQVSACPWAGLKRWWQRKEGWALLQKMGRPSICARTTGVRRDHGYRPPTGMAAGGPKLWSEDGTPAALVGGGVRRSAGRETAARASGRTRSQGRPLYWGGEMGPRMREDTGIMAGGKG